MRNDEHQQSHTYTLTLAAVKMKVKFPCRMALEQAGQILTTEVPPTEDCRFVFNQEIRIRQEPDRLFTELNVCLITEKGARYISGIARLYFNEILRAEGSRLVLTLAKCLDTEAFCELIVNRVTRETGSRKRTFTAAHDRNPKASAPRHPEDAQPPLPDFKSPKRYEVPQFGSETKSQAHFPVASNIRLRREQQDIPLKTQPMAMTQGLNPKRMVNVSPMAKGRAINSKNKYQPLEFNNNNNDYERDKAIEAEVYKENYQKLKQKYVKEAENAKNQLSKRMMLESNENNYKLEIVRLKIRNDQLEKNMNEKNQRIKELTLSIANIQGREGETAMLREDLNNKQHAIRLMEDTIITLSKENDELRFNNKEVAFKLQEKIMHMDNQMDIITSRYGHKQQEMEREIRACVEAIQQRDTEITRKNQMLEKEKRSVYQLERTLQNKLFEYDALLQAEKTNFKSKLQQSKTKLDESHALYISISQQKSSIQSDLQKAQSIIIKNEYEFKLYQQEINSLKNEIDQLKTIRDKHNELVKEFRVVSEHKTMLEKNHEKVMHSKDSTLEGMANQYKKEIDFQKKMVREYEEKTKQQAGKIIEQEGQLEIAKNGWEKSKKSVDSAHKQINELKQRQKSLRKNLKVREQQYNECKKQFEKLKERSQHIIDSLKQELNKIREEASKVKIELQTQIMKNDQITETNSELNMEMTRLKMSLQFSEEKYEKFSQNTADKCAQFEKIIRENEQTIQNLQDKIKNQKITEKDILTRLQKCDYEIGQAGERFDKMQKELRAMDEKNKILESSLKMKHAQLQDFTRKVAQSEGRISSSDDTVCQLRDQLQTVRNELQKSKRITEILEKDYEKAKNDISNYLIKINQQQSKLDERQQELRREKENLVSLESRWATLKKQSDKFKESVSEAISNSFVQLSQTFSIMDKHESRTSSHPVIDYSAVSVGKKGLIDLSNDLVTAIMQAGKENKSSIVKYSEKVKSLEREIDSMKSQMEKVQQISKKQLQDKEIQLERIEQQLRNTKNEKGEALVQTNMQINDLEEQLRNYQQEYNAVISLKSELEFTVTSLQLEVERAAQQANRKLLQSKKQRQQIEEKLQYQYHASENLMKKIHELQVEIMNFNSILMIEREQSYKKDLLIAEKQEERRKTIEELDNMRRLFKHCEEKYSELDIQFVTVREIKEKYESMLSDEENKLKEIRVFNSSILKEKEEIIKNQLQKNVEITNLENNVSQLRHLLQEAEDSKNQHKLELDQSKQNLKKTIVQMKQLENSLNQQKAKTNDLKEKAKDKELILQQYRSDIETLKKKIEQAALKSKNIQQQLKRQKEHLSQQLDNLTIQSNDTIRSLESQLSKLNNQIQTSKQENGELQEAIFVERENNQAMQDTIGHLKNEVDDFKKKLEELEKQQAELQQENREKDEQMYEMGGRIYEYEARFKELEEQKQRELEELSNGFNLKYDEECQQFNQKIEFIEKEKDYLREKLTEKEEEVTRKQEELKHKEIEQAEVKKIYEEKLKKIDEEKLQIYTDKNKELAKAMEEQKQQFETIRLKQAEIRKISHQLEISRSCVQKIEGKVKDMQNEKSIQLKAFQTQLENLRKKELTYKAYRDQVRSNQWACEREVRKQIQNFIKKILEQGEKEVRNESVITLIKSLEEGLLAAIAAAAKD